MLLDTLVDPMKFFHKSHLSFMVVNKPLYQEPRELSSHCGFKIDRQSRISPCSAFRSSPIHAWHRS